MLPPRWGSDRGDAHVSISGLSPGAKRCHPLWGFGIDRHYRRKDAKTNMGGLLPIRVRTSVLPPLRGSDRGIAHTSISGFPPGATCCRRLRRLGIYRRYRRKEAKTNTGGLLPLGRPPPYFEGASVDLPARSLTSKDAQGRSKGEDGFLLRRSHPCASWHIFPAPRCGARPASFPNPSPAPDLGPGIRGDETEVDGSPGWGRRGTHGCDSDPWD